jgi:capsid protein
VDQDFMAARVLDRILAAWLWEYALAMGVLSEGATGTPPAHQWFWDGQEHVDPAKEASAQETRLKNHTTTLAQEYARQGKDWEAELRQRGKELSLMRELGLQEAQGAPKPAMPAPADGEGE